MGMKTFPWCCCSSGFLQLFQPFSFPLRFLQPLSHRKVCVICLVYPSLKLWSISAIAGRAERSILGDGDGAGAIMRCRQVYEFGRFILGNARSILQSREVIMEGRDCGVRQILMRVEADQRLWLKRIVGDGCCMSVNDNTIFTIARIHISVESCSLRSSASWATVQAQRLRIICLCWWFLLKIDKTPRTMPRMSAAQKRRIKTWSS